jgi:hypothetical protein
MVPVDYLQNQRPGKVSPSNTFGVRIEEGRDLQQDLELFVAR